MPCTGQESDIDRYHFTPSTKDKFLIVGITALLIIDLIKKAKRFIMP